jgi:hypothetical protein
MAVTLAQRAEIQKLSRLLGAAEGKLDFLGKMDLDGIRRLREQATAQMFKADQAKFQKVAASSRLLPAPLIAVIAQKVFGPLLCARTAGLFPAARAVDVAKRLETSFLADVCMELDPRRAREVVTGMPAQQVVQIARELARREEFVTMGRFVDCLSEAALRAVIADLKSDEVLLRIGFFVEDKRRLGLILSWLPRERLSRLVQVAAAGDAELWPEALNMLNSVGEEQRAQLADLAAELDDKTIARMIASSQEQKLWGAMLPVIAHMNREHQKRLIKLVPLGDPTVLGDILRAVDATGLWEQFLPLAELMSPRDRERTALLAQSLGSATAGSAGKALRALAKSAVTA